MTENTLRLDMQRKFENTNKRLQELNDHLKTNIVDQMNESVVSVKDTITDALKEDNAQLRNKVELLVKKLTEVEISRSISLVCFLTISSAAISC